MTDGAWSEDAWPKSGQWPADKAVREMMEVPYPRSRIQRGKGGPKGQPAVRTIDWSPFHRFTESKGILEPAKSVQVLHMQPHKEHKT